MKDCHHPEYAHGYVIFAKKFVATDDHAHVSHADVIDAILLPGLHHGSEFRHCREFSQRHNFVLSQVEPWPVSAGHF